MRIERYLTKPDVEATLNLHRNTLTRLLAAGRFPRAFRTGNRWRIPVGDVERFACERRRQQEQGNSGGLRGTLGDSGGEVRDGR
jgi:excisionase family DNA binding protein